MMKRILAICTVGAVLLLFVILNPVQEKPDSSESTVHTSGTTVSMESVPSTQTEATTQSTTVATQPTVATTQPTTVPTQPTTAPTVKPTTQPTTPPTTAKKPVSTNPTVAAFEAERMETWKCPVKVVFGEVTGSRTFASSRGDGSRAHAGLDFVAPHGTKVYAITSGTVQRIALFYYNTSAIEIKNDDGTILRYCEIDPDVEVGDYVEQGQLIGTILRADTGTEMLHMEVYYGNGEGMLTQSGNNSYTFVDSTKKFMRRSDLMDPTFLMYLPVS